MMASGGGDAQPHLDVDESKERNASPRPSSFPVGVVSTSSNLTPCVKHFKRESSGYESGIETPSPSCPNCFSEKIKLKQSTSNDSGFFGSPSPQVLQRQRTFPNLSDITEDQSLGSTNPKENAQELDRDTHAETKLTQNDNRNREEIVREQAGERKFAASAAPEEHAARDASNIPSEDSIGSGYALASPGQLNYNTQNTAQGSKSLFADARLQGNQTSGVYGQPVDDREVGPSDRHTLDTQAWDKQGSDINSHRGSSNFNENVAGLGGSGATTPKKDISYILGQIKSLNTGATAIDPELDKCFTECLLSKRTHSLNDMTSGMKSLLYHQTSCKRALSCAECSCINVLIQRHYAQHHALCMLKPCIQLQEIVHNQSERRKHQLSRWTLVRRDIPLQTCKADIYTVQTVFSKHIGQIYVNKRRGRISQTSNLVSTTSSQRARILSQARLDDAPSTTLSVGEFDDTVQDLPPDDVIYCDYHEICHRAGVWDEMREEQQPRLGHEGCILRRYREVLQIQNGQYQLNVEWGEVAGMGRLGAGAMGTCVLATDTSSRHSFCAKEIALSMFNRREIDVWSKLNHPNIAKFMGAVRIDIQIILFTEFVNQGDLHARIRDRGQGRGLRRSEYIPYMRDLLDALIYLHTSQFCLHEDIKANNVMIHGKFDGTFDCCKLIDFGLARQLDPEHPYVPEYTSFCGGPTQASPEKASSQQYGFAADIWAFACTFIHVVSGSMPWEKRYPGCDRLEFIIWENSPPVQDIPSDCPVDVRQMIVSALNMNQLGRPTAVKLRQHPIFDASLEDEMPAPSAVVRNNPRLAVTQDEYMNSVPSRPPEAHYQPPNQALHASIPDFSLLRIDSDEHERSSEWGTHEGGGRNENDGLSSFEISHEGDGLSSGEYTHEDDGLSSDEETGDLDIAAMIMQDPKRNSRIVVPRWDVMPQFAIPTQDYNAIEDYSLQALGIFAGATANQSMKDTGHGDIGGNVMVPMLDELHHRDTSTSSSNNPARNSGDTNVQVQSLSNPSEISIGRENNQNDTLPRNVVSNSFSAGFNLQSAGLRQVQHSENNVLDNTVSIGEQTLLPQCGQGDATGNLSDNRHSRTSSGGFSDIVCNNVGSPSSNEQMFPSELLNAAFDNLSINTAPTFVQAAGRLPELTLPSQALNVDFNANKSPENLSELPNLLLLHEEDADSELHDDAVSLRSTSRVSNTQQLLEDMQLEFAENCLQDPANATIARQLSDYHSSLREQRSVSCSGSVTSERETSRAQEEVEQCLAASPKKGTFLRFQTVDGREITAVHILCPYQYTWRDIINEHTETLSQEVSKFKLRDANDVLIQQSDPLPVNQSVIVKVVPLNM